MIRRGLFLLLLFIMAMTAALVGCSSDSANGGTSNEQSNEGSSSNTGDNSNSNDNESSKPEEPPAELTMMVFSHANWPYNENQEQWHWIGEATNTHVEVQALEGEAYNDQVNLSVASGDMPDLYWALGANTFNKLGAQGAFIDLKQHLDKMPNLKKALEENPDREYAISTADGKMYIAPTMGFSADGQRLWLYRQDIFEKHNLEAPKTYDEIYAVAKKLKEIYPDSYPLIWRSSTNRLEAFAPQFGVNHKFYADHDTNTFTYGPVRDGFKLMLQKLNKMYEEDLIHPEWLTLTTKQWSQAVAASQSFMLVDYIGRTDFFNNKVQPSNPEFKMAYMEPPAGCDSCPREQMFYGGAINGMSVSSTTENLDAALKYIDWFYTKEGADMATWGKSGEVFTSSGGEMVLTDEWKAKEDIDFTKIREDVGIFTNGTYLKMYQENAFTSLASEQNREEMSRSIKFMAKDPLILEPPLTDLERQETSMLVESINKKMDENISRFIMGERSFDEWDQHVKELNDLGLQKVLDIYTEAYQRLQ